MARTLVERESRAPHARASSYSSPFFPAPARARIPRAKLAADDDVATAIIVYSALVIIDRAHLLQTEADWRSKASGKRRSH